MSPSAMTAFEFTEITAPLRGNVTVGDEASPDSKNNRACVGM
jgi:hypothetical protein